MTYGFRRATPPSDGIFGFASRSYSYPSNMRFRGVSGSGYNRPPVTPPPPGTGGPNTPPTPPPPPGPVTPPPGPPPVVQNPYMPPGLNQQAYQQMLMGWGMNPGMRFPWLR